MAAVDWKKRTRGLLSLVRRSSSTHGSSDRSSEDRKERTLKKTPRPELHGSDLPGMVFYYSGSCSAAVKAFRKAAKSHGLRIPFEFNVAEYIEDELGIGLRPCRVLCVVCPYLLLQAAVWDGSGASFLPIRVVFSANGAKTRIHVVGPFNPLLPNGLRVPFKRFLQALANVLMEMGARGPDLRPCA